MHSRAVDFNFSVGHWASLDWGCYIIVSSFSVRSQLGTLALTLGFDPSLKGSNLHGGMGVLAAPCFCLVLAWFLPWFLV